MKRQFFVLSILFVLVCSAFARAADGPYAIQFNRRQKAGDIYSLQETMDLTTTTDVRRDGAILQSEKSVLNTELSGRIKVEKVNDLGSPVVFTVSITRFVSNDPGKDPEILIAAGKELKVERREEDVLFSLSGGEVISDKSKEILQQLYTPSRSKVSDDDVFGSKEQRRVGDTWKINNELAAKDLGTGSATVEAKDIQGTVTLKSVETIGDMEVQRVVGTMSITNLMPKDLPPGFALDHSEAQAQMLSLMPINVSKAKLVDQMDMTMKIALKGADGVAISLERKVSRKAVRTEIPK